MIHSYETAGVNIVDHHTIAEEFERFEKQEEAAGREVAREWSWLIPATTHTFHSSYDDTMRTPNIFYRDSVRVWPSHRDSGLA